MAVETVAAFVEAVRQSRVLELAQQRDLEPLLARFPDTRALGRELIQRGWLTPYQVNQLVQGRGNHLVLGPYVLLERLGEGGMGQVFKARHQRLGRVVALKVIRPEHLANNTAVHRFHREARAAANLDHPNIVHTYDADQVGNTHFLALEYVEGVDLGKRLRDKGPLPVALACEYVRQAALGLHHAHERGMVHRDVKPSNLIATERDGVVKILDMGLAKLLPMHQEDSGSMVTVEGAVIGTLDYMAPEQAKDSHAADGRADLYSLGCTLFHLLSGQPPFADGTGMEKLLKHQLDPPPPLRRLRPEVPPEVEAIVQRLLAKHPDDRFQSGAELAVALMPFCGTAVPFALPGGDAHPVALPARPDASTPKPVAMPVPDTVGSTWSGLATPTPGDSRPEPPTPASRRVRRKRKPNPLALVVGAATAGVLLALLLAVFLRSKGVTTAPATYKATPPPAVPPQAFLPDDIALLVAVNLRQALASPVGKQYLRGELREAVQAQELAQALRRDLGVDLLANVDRLTVACTSRFPDSPLILIAGTFDRATFLAGAAGKWLPREIPASGEPLRYFQQPPRPGGPRLFVALPWDDVAVCCTEETLVRELLARVRLGRTITWKDPDVERLWNQQSTQRPLVIAGRAGPLGKSGVYAGQERPQRVLNEATVSGGLDLTDDVRLELRFVASLATFPVADLAKVLTNGLDTLRKSLAAVPPGRGLDLVNRLLRTATLTAEKNTVVVTARLTDAEIKKTVRPKPSATASE